MNIFILGPDPVSAARDQCNKHVVKMILESAQMLSTAHRILDGTVTERLSSSGKRTVKYWEHPRYESELYKAVHQHHPCTLWTLKCSGNYFWHYVHWATLCLEYNRRFDREHMSFIKLSDILYCLPEKITVAPASDFAQAMPEQFRIPGDPVTAYRNYYKSKKNQFEMKWPDSPPDWFE